LLEYPPDIFPDVISALTAIPWRRRLDKDSVPATVDCLVDWIPTPKQLEAPDDALVWYDVPLTFEPPAHRPRFVIRKELRVGEDGEVNFVKEPLQSETPSPPRPRANYRNSEFRRIREERLIHDHRLCVFCKSPANTVQHINYRHAGGDERLKELRSLCRLCHDAVTMIEYGLNMGLDRINPEEERWRDLIIKKRAEIIEFRSMETRRRKLAAEEV
jgi:5-methylcytosine-specific restriction endonuclease McrA